MIAMIQNLFNALGWQQTANNGDLFGLLAVLILFSASLFMFLRKTEPAKRIEPPQESVVEDQASEALEIKVETKTEVEEKPEVAPPPKVSWSERLKKGLSRSHGQVWGRLGSLFSGGALTDEQLEEIEELLYTADIGPKTAMELTEAITERAKQGNFTEVEFKNFLFEFLKEKMASVHENVDTDLYQFSEENRGKTKVIMVVGVNGAGKTTTIGKLATKLTAQGANVVVGACDTFRAAAVDQLQVWCDRAGATMIRAKEGSNPSGVGFEALKTALEQKADYCILDTAGRLHTKGNLMEELAKSKNVLKKLDETAPHHVLLVIDAITGQNAIRQAEEFNKTLDLTGLIFTKCDGSSKAGSAVSIVQSLKVPITYIGVGESVEDLNNFNLDEYLGALLDLRV